MGTPIRFVRHGTTNDPIRGGRSFPEPPVHVVPVRDLREHETEHGADCWCEPAVIHEDGAVAVVIVHEALDGRA